MLYFPDIQPEIFSIGPLSIRWYGMMYVLGFASAWILGRYRANRQHLYKGPFSPAQFDSLLIYGFIGVIVGARLGYVVFYKFSYYLQNPTEIFALWHGGMSFHGGLLGVIFAGWLGGKNFDSSLLRTMDFIAPLVPPGLFFGRIGNFINAELWGRTTTLPWGMVFPGYGAGPLPRHPSQLYEAALEGLVLFIILWTFSKKPRPAGAVSGLFLIGYGCFRFIVEFAREPDAHLGFIWGPLTMGMLLCIPMLVLGSFLFRRACKANNKIK
ncbi:MAG: prolipoprotein diacylglyceryl transferase [Deltaproteobacteria bacterium]|jgi:phosphatidylglycerol:prolipoprotein diacylglycerol transferase|nr:prolipoprotein diacylglyceryl transferase [Deltaproteobacteria bacterium]